MIDARIRINGDIFDAVPSSKNDPRDSPNATKKSLHGKVATHDSAIKEAVDLLSPYAENIDWLGIGNHEEAVIRYCRFDPVQNLLDKLNSRLEIAGSKHRILYGGISGFEQTAIQIRSERMQQRPVEEQDGANVRHVMFYHHGAGGEAPITKGTINVSRAAMAFEYDSTTEGHRHNLMIMNDVVLRLTPSGQVVSKKRLTMLTASYMQNYLPTGQENPLDYTYAESKRYAPKPMGGIFHILTPSYESRKKNGKPTSVLTIDQSAHSDLQAFDRHITANVANA